MISTLLGVRINQMEANNGRNVFWGVSIRGEANNKQIKYTGCSLMTGTRKKDKARGGERVCDMHVGCSFH